MVRLRFTQRVRIPTEQPPHRTFCRFTRTPLSPPPWTVGPQDGSLELPAIFDIRLPMPTRILPARTHSRVQLQLWEPLHSLSCKGPNGLQRLLPHLHHAFCTVFSSAGRLACCTRPWCFLGIAWGAWGNPSSLESPSHPSVTQYTFRSLTDLLISPTKSVSLRPTSITHPTHLLGLDIRYPSPHPHASFHLLC